MAKRKGQVAGRGFWAITPAGAVVHVNGKRDMPEEMLNQLLTMMDAAAKNAAEIMPCGHCRADIVSSDEGAEFCGQCRLDEVYGTDEL